MGPNSLGILQTFSRTMIVYFQIGMVFGSSFSLKEVDCISWVKTSLPKRIIRSILGAVIAIGIFVGCEYIQPKNSFFNVYCA